MSAPGLKDRELAERLLGRHAPQQGVNQVARQLASAGQLVRRNRSDGRIGNYPGNGAQRTVPVLASPIVQQPGAFLSEDDAKRKLDGWLERAGWKVSVVLGRGHGIDMRRVAEIPAGLSR